MSHDLDQTEMLMLSFRDDGEFDAVNEDDYGLSELNIIKDDIMQKVREAFLNFKIRYKMPELEGVFDPWDIHSFPQWINAIRSMVGDDEVITSNSLLYSVLCILMGPILSRIKISWEDVQFNNHLFNYAEGWVFLPPSRDADFESVNRYNKGNGVPFVADFLKFKDLSCVRKQSAMDHDLPSKFRNLAQKAAWTHPSWLTWASHQWALILGIEIFDFMRSRTFPYLFQTEGGCGGAPPWNNMYTAAAAVHRYRGGKAKRGIIGVMSDANQLQRGEITPHDAFFTKNLNLALSGDKRWEIIRSELEQNESDQIMEGAEPRDSIMGNAETTIPDVLIKKSATVEPQDAYTGIAMSFLREKGYILTELDLVMRVENEKRLRAIWGRVPMLEIENQIELRKEQYRDAYLVTLSDLSKKRIDRKTRSIAESIEDPMDPQSLAIMAYYYKIRVEQSLPLTTFMYNERIRVFKLDDVETYFNRGMKGIKDRFSADVGSYYRPEHRKTIQHPRDADTFNEVEKWLRSDDLDQLLTQPIPAGIGPDDSRIARSLLIGLDNDAGAYDGYVILIVTSDKRAIHSLQLILSHGRPNVRIRVCGLRIPDYLVYCILNKSRLSDSRGRYPPWLQGNIYDVVKHRLVQVEGPLIEVLFKQSQFLWNCKSPRLVVEYDFPNINRGLKRFKIFPNKVEEMTGGFLSKGFLDSDLKFPTRTLDSIQSLSEFTCGRRRSYYPSAMLRDKPLELYSPMSLRPSKSKYLN